MNHANSLHHARKMIHHVRKSRSRINHERRRVLMKMKSLDKFKTLLGASANHSNIKMFLTNRPYRSTKKQKSRRSTRKSRSRNKFII